MTAHSPPGFSSTASLIYHTAASTLVLLNPCGYPSFESANFQTWKFSGTDWSLVSGFPTVVNTNATYAPISNTQPSPIRSGFAAAYDATDNQIVMWGGKNLTSAYNYCDDTWALNSSLQWIQNTTSANVSQASAPQAREGSFAVPTSSGIQMFGGFDNHQFFNQDADGLWSFSNAAGWVSASQSSFPSIRSKAAVAANSNIIVMFGGAGIAGEAKNDCWIYNGSWAQINQTGLSTTSGGPSGRYGSAFAYFPSISKYVLFSGALQNGQCDLSMFTFDGVSTWASVALPKSNLTCPSARINAAMVYSPANGGLVLFGGQNNSQTSLQDTWVLNSSLVWTQL